MDKEIWDDLATNAEQNYLTHGVFRYFGKLPPTLTRRILTEVGVKSGQTVVDVMCGSGTTLVEAIEMGASAIGVDCNDLSALIAKVKTTPLSEDRFADLLEAFRGKFQSILSSPILPEMEKCEPNDPDYLSDLPKIRNFDHWFDAKSAHILFLLRAWVESLGDCVERDVAMVAFAATIRPSSRASVRTGRLFVDVNKKLPNPALIFENRLVKIRDAVAPLASSASWKKFERKLVVADARSTGLNAGCADVVFCHPPYFALYRYSSDPLRFELEWLRFNRKEISVREIEDGFKTTDEKLTIKHIEDLRSVLFEGRRIALKGGKLVVVTADTTLRKERLDILDPIIEGASKIGWKLERRIIRKVRFAQASYHKSYDAEIQRPDDEILIFQAV